MLNCLLGQCPGWDPTTLWSNFYLIAPWFSLEEWELGMWMAGGMMYPSRFTPCKFDVAMEVLMRGLIFQPAANRCGCFHLLHWSFCFLGVFLTLVIILWLLPQCRRIWLEPLFISCDVSFLSNGRHQLRTFYF